MIGLFGSNPGPNDAWRGLGLLRGLSKVAEFVPVRVGRLGGFCRRIRGAGARRRVGHRRPAAGVLSENDDVPWLIQLTHICGSSQDSTPPILASTGI